MNTTTIRGITLIKTTYAIDIPDKYRDLSEAQTLERRLERKLYGRALRVQVVSDYDGVAVHIELGQFASNQLSAKEVLTLVRAWL